MEADRDLILGRDPRVFVTDPNDPTEGRTFVWAKTKWYEREEGDSGDVAFTPVADSEEELHEWLAEQGLDLDEVDRDTDYGRTVREEFLDQAPLYPEAPELSTQPLYPGQESE